PNDDVIVPPGYCWISLTSATEGVSHVTAYAPGSATVPARRQTALVHWIDGEWVFPSPAVVPAGGSHRLVTTIRRQTTGAPVPNWLVKYEVVGGAPAGFGPQRQPGAETATDPAGAASVELSQPAPAPG